MSMNTSYLNRFEQSDPRTVVVFDGVLVTKTHGDKVTPLTYSRATAQIIMDKNNQYGGGYNPGYEVISLNTYQLRYEYDYLVRGGKYVPLYMFPGQWVQCRSKKIVLDHTSKTVQPYTPGKILSIEWDETCWLMEVQFEGIADAHWVTSYEVDFIDAPSFVTGQRVLCWHSALKDNKGLGAVTSVAREQNGSVYVYHIKLDSGLIFVIDETGLNGMLEAVDGVGV